MAVGGTQPLVTDAHAASEQDEASLVLCRLLAMEDGFVRKKYDQEIKARAVRMVRDHLPTYGSVTRAADAVGPQLGISGNTLRRWVVQADVDDGVREGVPSDVHAELARLTAENRRLRETNEILRRGGCRRDLMAIWRGWCSMWSPSSMSPGSWPLIAPTAEVVLPMTRG